MSRTQLRAHLKKANLGIPWENVVMGHDKTQEAELEIAKGTIENLRGILESAEARYDWGRKQDAYWREALDGERAMCNRLFKRTQDRARQLTEIEAERGASEAQTDKKPQTQEPAPTGTPQGTLGEGREPL